MMQYDFIELIKQKRIKAKMTQMDLAKLIPISKESYSKIENHKQNINYYLILRLAIILDIDLNIIKKENAKRPFYYD